jgi:NAD(P)-dependent dehydrogenase (short-subunit alcohol dehydrogenase family)
MDISTRGDNVDLKLYRPAFGLSGKVALVTGGTRGIGRAIAFGLAAAGADVVVASRKADNCRTTAEEITAATGQAALGVAAHVGRWDEMPALVDAAYDRFGHLDVLVNNAGIGPAAPSMAGITEELFDRTIGVNLKGPLRLASLVGKRMAAADGGAIINISSMSAFKARPATAVYAAAKAGLNAVTIALAQEYAPKVRVNAIGVGPVRTDISASWFDSPERGGDHRPAAGCRAHRVHQHRPVPGERVVIVHYRLDGPGRRRRPLVT